MHIIFTTQSNVSNIDTAYDAYCCIKFHLAVNSFYFLSAKVRIAYFVKWDSMQLEQ